MKIFGRIVMAVSVACLVSLATASLSADEKTKGGQVNLGDPAPTFESTDDQGNPWKSTDHVGKRILVIYFYPADLTGGCTMQACGYRDDMKKLADKGVEVVGVSGDSVENHQKFKKAKELNFTLLADEDGAVAKKFGVPVDPGGEAKVKDADGSPIVLKRGVTIKRWTVVIGKDGKVIYKAKVDKPAQDSKQILEVIEKQSQ
jgi:thioredoxin-dependent peroxiredoxin